MTDDTTRDALEQCIAKALVGHAPSDTGIYYGSGVQLTRGIADAVEGWIATLADDEAVVDAVSDIAYRGQHLTANHVRVLLLEAARVLMRRTS